ncbi:hypothetical protein GmHk_09G025282 [Glycine max]|nr:hypothetical protein GmHk_09G025282 [Glycine max]
MVEIVLDMSSGGPDSPRPPSHDFSGKGTTAKKRLYMFDVIYPSPSSVSILVKPPDVAPTPSSPPTEGRPSSSHVNSRGPPSVPASTPFPSSIDARGPSPVPISTPSLSPPMGNMPMDEDAINLAMEDPPPPLNDHPMVTLINGEFHPSKVAAKAVTLSIRQQFGQPWPTWGAIPKDHHKLFFQCFKRKLVWRPEEEIEIKKAFNSKASHRLSEMFRDA